jgi:Ca-activated chloride channel family protein
VSQRLKTQNRKPRVGPVFCASLLLFLTTGAAGAGDVRDLVRQGNAHYAAGRYAEALKSYEEAVAGTAHSPPELLHDLAAAHFKLGQLDEARDLWVRIKEAGDAGLEARTRYNLGNCDYAEALAAAPKNPQQALDRLGTAAEQYRAALGLDPGLADARANLELTQLLKKQIEEQTQKQPQSQPSKDQQKQDTQKQDSSSQPSSQSSQSQPSQQDQQNQSASSQPSQTQPAQQSDSSEQQQNQEQQQEQPEESPQSQPQAMPAETQPSSAPQPSDGSPVIHLSREQAERLLQMIRDAEKARREKLAQQRSAGQKKVERDW